MNHTTVKTEHLKQQMMLMDESCKRLLSTRRVLAWILKECVFEFRDVKLADIETKYIEDVTMGEPLFQIYGMNTEDYQEEETIRYDIRFMVKVPNKKEQLEMMINIEAQRKYHTGYPIIKRGIYYCSRMISGQYGTIFVKSHYEKIRKVYSIWITMDPPKYRENTMSVYEIAERNRIGKGKEKRENYDLMSTIILCLPKEEAGGEGIMRMLKVLLSEKIETEEKERILAEEFQMAMKQEMKEESENMCNIGECIAEEAMEKGMKKGIKQGRKEGRNQGKKENAMEIAKRMLDAKFSLEDIVNITKLSMKEVKKLMAS